VIRTLTLIWPLLAVLPGTPARAALAAEAFVRIGASVLQVEAPQARGGFSLGSGVVVGNGRVVTNCHVTRGADEIRVVQGGLRWRAQAKANDLDHDLCLLDVPGLPAPPVDRRAGAALAVGQPVTALGYTGGIGMQNSAGEVVSLHRLDGASVVQCSNWFSSGASGGGLFDDDGRLVGVLTFRLRGANAHAFAAPVEWVQALIDGAGRGAFTPIAPLDEQALPYWQKPGADQPHFLRAAALLRDDRWAELETTARAWLRDDAGDGEPWYFLGVSLERQGRPAQARQALECSLTLEPARESAWLLLAPLYERLGLTVAANAVRARLVATVKGRPAATEEQPMQPCATRLE
jgi:tetratricopeptide (TPR) repeat protein